MSMSFDIFPANMYIPGCEEIKKISQGLLENYLSQENIDFNISLAYRKQEFETNKSLNSEYLVTSEKEYQSFVINNTGEVLVFFRGLSEIDREFWKEEISINDKAGQLKNQIETSLKIGYMWNVKRTMNQPAIISIYYGFLAIAIAALTDGIIYSDDGGWDSRCFPLGAEQFMDEYLNLSELQDRTIKEFTEKCLRSLKERNF